MENIALVTVKIPAPRPIKPVRTGPKQATKCAIARASISSQPKKMAPLGNSQGPNTTFARSGAPPPQDATLGVKFVSAGTAACIADMATFPLDTAKVRLQIQGEGVLAAAAASSRQTIARSAFSSSHSTAAALAAAAGPKYRGLLGTVATISREEGVRSLYSGLVPGLQRQMAFASVRIGLYDAVKTGYGNILKVDPNQKNIGLRILAGITTGGAAVIVAQPTDVVKVRMQAQSRSKPRYSGCISAYRTIAIKEGARGLWKGCLPNVTRNAVVNCTELVSYDLIKEAILTRALLSDNIPCHFLAAVGAGFFTTLFASPIDVVKTRFMNSAPGQYNGAVECALKMYREAGLKAFYKGCVPAFLRFGPWNVVMFVSYEQLKKQFTKMNGGYEQPRQPRPAPLELKSIQSSSSSPSPSRFM